MSRTGVVLFCIASGVSVAMFREAQATPPVACRDPVVVAAAYRVGTGVDLHGDPLPPGAIARLGYARMRHGEPLQHLLFCGRLLIAADELLVRAWDPATGASRGRWRVAPDPYPGQVSRLQCVGSVPHVLTLSGRDATLDLATGTFSWREIGRQLLDAVLVGDSAIVLRPNAVERRTCNATTVLRARSTYGTEVAQLSHDGKRFATATSDAIELAAGLTDSPRSIPITSKATHLTWSTDDRRVLVAHEDKTVTVLDAVGGVERALGPFDTTIESIAASRDLVAVGLFAGRLLRFEVATGHALPPLQIGGEGVEALAFSSDGGQLAIAGEDLRIRVIDARARAAPPDPADAHAAWPRGVLFSPDGTKVVTWSDRTRIWDARTGAEEQVLPASSSVAWHGDTIITVDDRVGDFTLRRTSRRTSRSASLTARFPSADFTASDDQSTLVYATSKEWSVMDTTHLSRRSHGAPSPGYSEVDNVTINRGGSTVALCLVPGATGGSTRVEVFASSGARVASWDLEDRQLCPTLSLSPDGRWLAASNGLLLQVDRRSPPATLDGVGTTQGFHAPIRLEESLSAPRFSPDGSRLAGGMSDGEVRIWDVRTHAVVRRLRGHDGHLRSIAWSPGADRLVSLGNDRDAIVWDAAGTSTERTSPEADASAR